MRVILVLVLLVAIAFGVGWVVMDRTDESVNIRIDTKKVETDTGRLIDSAKDALGQDTPTDTSNP